MSRSADVSGGMRAPLAICRSRGRAHDCPDLCEADFYAHYPIGEVVAAFCSLFRVHRVHYEIAPVCVVRPRPPPFAFLRFYRGRGAHTSTISYALRATLQDLYKRALITSRARSEAWHFFSASAIKYMLAAAVAGASHSVAPIWWQRADKSRVIRDRIVIDDMHSENHVLALGDAASYSKRSLQTVACTPTNDNDYNYEACLSWCPNNLRYNCPRCKYVHHVNSDHADAALRQRHP